MILCFATRISVTAHYFKYYIGEQQASIFGKIYNFGFIELTSAFNGINQALSIIAVLFTKWIAEIFGKKKAYISLFLITVISIAAYFFLKPENIILIFVLQIIGSITGAPLTPLIWAMYADAADYSEWKKGRRATGLVFSASTMSQKFGWAVGTAFAGLLLSWFGFQANIAQSIEVQTGLRTLISLIPAAAGFIAVIFMYFYKLDEKTMQQIETELASKRNV
jgi:GPH family glycoside/pentoside/hexuronide:cation symporter